MKCLVFCDLAHDIYLDFLSKYPSSDLNIVRVYACGEAYKSCSNFELFSLSTIMEKQVFDTALVFLSDTSLVHSLLKKVYGEDAPFSFLDYKTFSSKCLSGAGQLELIRQDISMRYPSDTNLIMGDFSYYISISILDEIKDGSVKVKVGKFCSIGPTVNFALAVEHKGSWNTSYPFNRLLGIETRENSSVASKGDIIIGNDVWIGADATILSGVTIGDGCIVGNHAVVTKNVEPFSVIAGNPGRVIKKRFTLDKIEKLQEIKWWDWNLQMIYDALPLLQSEDISALYSYWMEKR